MAITAQILKKRNAGLKSHSNSKKSSNTNKSGKCVGSAFNIVKVKPVPADDWYSAEIRNIIPKEGYTMIAVSPYAIDKAGKKTFYAKAYLRLNRECDQGSYEQELADKFIEMFEINSNTLYEEIIGKEIDVYIEANEGEKKTFYNITDIADLDDADDSEDYDTYSDNDDSDEDDEDYEDNDEENVNDNFFEDDDVEE